MYASYRQSRIHTYAIYCRHAIETVGIKCVFVASVSVVGMFFQFSFSFGTNFLRRFSKQVDTLLIFITLVQPDFKSWFIHSYYVCYSSQSHLWQQSAVRSDTLTHWVSCIERTPNQIPFHPNTSNREIIISKSKGHNNEYTINRHLTFLF